MTNFENQSASINDKGCTSSGAEDETAAIRVGAATKAKIDKILAAANNKDLGRRVKTDAVISFALDLMNDSHIQTIRDASLTNMDRMELLFQQTKRRRKGLTKDEFIGMLMSGQIDQKAN